MHSILDEFRRENIMARGNSIVPFSQPRVSPDLIRTDLIGKTVYQCASVRRATRSRLTYVNAPTAAMADRLTNQKKKRPLYFGSGRCGGKSPDGGSGSRAADRSRAGIRLRMPIA
jgi:hypothetical protein